ncbi:hypothetical protein BCR41DRAFT_88178 [Lobosporangium transversale]|uniref:Uncharacterized protein n=1 Tax=Lobosporangium transversale TaxID=64571 RepID=A0A1Y2GLF4_9FUNG|nr:hypothetical protein BCR41DRAFT_88178 [Lobosporangium transversale]ORZ14452.1 hypothetical protein BCR41DRAFT_88178 [Lobosporangium transversale]|eukprot:XP_021880930.1 hypothetical protein BCR41DRAFT_88178 [Lobosporangium transversale]
MNSPWDAPPSGGGWNMPVAAASDNMSTDFNNDWTQMAKKMEASMISENVKHSHSNDDVQEKSSFTSEKASFAPEKASFAPENSSFAPDLDEPPAEKLEDVWPLFLEADKTRDLDDVKPMLGRICDLYRGRSWRDLEEKLRADNCNTYLVATNEPVGFGYTLVNLKGEPRQEFRVIPSFIKPGTVKRGRMSIGMPYSEMS